MEPTLQVACKSASLQQRAGLKCGRLEQGLAIALAACLLGTGSYWQLLAGENGRLPLCRIIVPTGPMLTVCLRTCKWCTLSGCGASASASDDEHLNTSHNTTGTRSGEART